MLYKMHAPLNMVDSAGMLTRPVRHEAEARCYEAEAEAKAEAKEKFRGRGHNVRGRGRTRYSTSRLKITGWPESRRKIFGDFQVFFRATNLLFYICLLYTSPSPRD